MIRMFTSEIHQQPPHPPEEEEVSADITWEKKVKRKRAKL
jgi:hypothetical protein